MLEKEAEIKKLKEESRKLKTEVTVIYEDCLLNILNRRKLIHFSKIKKPFARLNEFSRNNPKKECLEFPVQKGPIKSF